MLRVVLDANVLRKDPFFKSQAFQLLVREGREGRVQVFVPEVVFDEAVNLHAEEVAEQRRQIARAIHRLERIGVDAEIELLGDFVASKRQTYREHLRRMFDAMDAVIVPYPSVGHDVVVRRALDRQRPFTPDGRVGYRDVLLWETVKGLAKKHGALMLITEDHAAFVERNDASRLLPELREELELLGLRDDCVLRLPDVKSFTDAHVESAQPALLELQHRLATEPAFESALIAAIRTRLDALASELSADELPLRFPAPVEDVELWFNDSKEPTIHAARELAKDAVLVELTVEVEGEVEFDLREADAAAFAAAGYQLYERDSYQTSVAWFVLRLPVEAVYDGRGLTLDALRMDRAAAIDLSPTRPPL